MAWLTASWFTGFVLPLLVALLQQLWKEWQDRQAVADAGAKDQQAADETEKSAAAESAQEIHDEVSNQSDDSVAGDLSKWLRR